MFSTIPSLRPANLVTAAFALLFGALLFWAIPAHAGLGRTDTGPDAVVINGDGETVFIYRDNTSIRMFVNVISAFRQAGYNPLEGSGLPSEARQDVWCEIRLKDPHIHMGCYTPGNGRIITVSDQVSWMRNDTRDYSVVPAMVVDLRSTYRAAASIAVPAKMANQPVLLVPLNW